MRKTGRGRGRPRKWQSPEEMAEAIEAYFAGLGEGEIPMVIPLAHHLDLTTEGLREYGKRDDFSATVTRAKERCAHALFVAGLVGGANPIICKLGLTANHGWKDRQDVTTGDRPARCGVLLAPALDAEDWMRRHGAQPQPEPEDDQY